MGKWNEALGSAMQNFARGGGNVASTFPNFQAFLTAVDTAERAEGELMAILEKVKALEKELATQKQAAAQKFQAFAARAEEARRNVPAFDRALQQLEKSQTKLASGTLAQVVGQLKIGLNRVDGLCQTKNKVYADQF